MTTSESRASPLRPTGIGVVGDMPWGTHFCQFYETKDDLLDILIPYFKAGLENNEFCIWITSDPVTDYDARNALKNAIPEANRYLIEGDIEIIPHSQWYLKDGALDLPQMMNGWRERLDRALAQGYAGLRASGNEAWLTEKHWMNFLDYEKELNQAIANQQIIVLCTYPLDRSNAAEVFDVARTHQFAIARRYGKWEVAGAPAVFQAQAETQSTDGESSPGLKRKPWARVIGGYTTAVLSVAAALLVALSVSGMAAAPVSLFFCALMFSAWYGGGKPGLLAMALSVLAFKYFFTAPIHSIAIESDEWPRLLLFVFSALFVVLLSATQSSAMESLKCARDALDGTVQEIKRTNESLQIKNAEYKRAEAALKTAHARLRALSARLQSVREEEATRIAREIHDELGQKLTGLKMDLLHVERKLEGLENSPTVINILDTIVSATELVDGLATNVQKIAAELRPGVLDKLGLGSALQFESRRFRESFGISCVVHLPEVEPDLSAEVSTTLFRIFQECLTNVVRHAHATKVETELKLEDGLVTMRVQDDGRGITETEMANPESLGLLGMKERAALLGGEIDFQRGAQGGTTVTVCLPQKKAPLRTKESV